MFGIEVENICKIGEEYENIVVGHVISVEKHPQADRLSICSVDVGESEPIQIICGAPNIGEKQFVPVARIGAKLGRKTIKEVKLRRVKSFGMICSEKELKLSDDHSGIMIFKAKYKPGTPLTKALDIEDAIMEVEITPNRPDLLGMIGIARDVSVMLDKEYKIPDFSFEEIEEPASDQIALELEAEELCPRYCARVIKNVEVKHSPDWMQKRLNAVGFRPINNIVDVTNYILMEQGHPLHAFALDKISDSKIIVRCAKENEEITLLDEEKYKLNPDNLVIADSKKPIALAGVMGGLKSSINEKTNAVVLECAYFNPKNIRKTSNEYNLTSESSSRFERGMDPNKLEKIIDRAAYLIQLTAGGEICAGVIDEYPIKSKPKKILLRTARINKLLSTKIFTDEIVHYLEKLEFSVKSTPWNKEFHRVQENNFQVTVPTFRPDIEREIDLIEEVARCYGYNKIEAKYYKRKIEDSFKIRLLRKIRTHLVKLGFFEVCNLSFSNTDLLDKLAIPAADKRRNVVELENPIGDQFSILRTSLIPDLLSNVKLNLAQNFDNFKLFELNKVYLKESTTSCSEPIFLTGVIVSNFRQEYWKEKQQSPSYFDVKGIVESLFEILQFQNGLEYKNSKIPYFAQEQCADIYPQTGGFIGSIGIISNKILSNFDIKSPCLLLDINISELIQLLSRAELTYKKIIKYPAVFRDIALVAPKNISMSEIKKIIKSVKPNIIRNITLFDLYTGSQIEEFHRSLTFRIEFQSSISTLTDNYIDKIFDKIVKKLLYDKKIKLRQ